MTPHALGEAKRLRAEIELGTHAPAAFRAALREVATEDRDAWCDRVLGLEGVSDDGPSLPAGGVPYLPCSVNDLLHAIESAAIGPEDVFVDVGSGVGRAATLVHLLTGAQSIGLEIQPELVRESRALIERLGISRVGVLEVDAAELEQHAPHGTVFFLYCPFGGERLTRALKGLESLAQRRRLRICCVDLPLSKHPWLRCEATPRPGLELHVSI